LYTRTQANEVQVRNVTSTSATGQAAKSGDRKKKATLL